MKTIFAATVLTAALGLTACDAAPEAALIEPPTLVATAAAAEETPEAWMARWGQQNQQLCVGLRTAAQNIYESRQEGVPRQVVLDYLAREQDFGPAAAPMRQLITLIYEATPAQLDSPAMPEVLTVLAMITCQRVIEALFANSLARKQP